MAGTVTGTVKWFSEAKGYGFVVGADGVDHHFNVSDVRGATLPRSGDTVQFEPGQSRRGPKARHVTLQERAGDRPSSGRPRSEAAPDDRVVCSSCSKRMVPRIITGPPLVTGRRWTPVPKRSICPFCGATYQTFPPSTGERVALFLFILLFVAIGGAVLLAILSER
jgi:cold shock CspA family protein